MTAPVILYTPAASTAYGNAYAAHTVPFNDPVDTAYPSSDPDRVDALFFLNQVQCEILKLQQLIYAGGAAIQVRNATGSTLNNGPVRVSGYYADASSSTDTGNPIFKIIAADAAANTFANALLLTSLADATTGVAYLIGDFTPSPALDTSGGAVGDPVYLKSGGGMTLTAPSAADTMVQVIGQIKTVNATGVVAGYVQTPKKFGTSWLQSLSVTTAKLASTGTNKVPLVTDGAGAVVQDTAPTSADAAADLMINASAAGKKALVIQAKASQTNNLFEIQSSDGVTQFAINLGAATRTGPNNTNLGTNAGSALIGGSNNTNVGVNAGTLITSGSYNTNIGSLAGANVAGGSNNTIIGKNAATTLTSGSSNIIIGSDADVPASGTANTFIAGSPALPVSDVYFGGGALAAASSGGADWRLNGNGGNGTNQTGGNLILAGGKGTGNAEPGLAALKYPLKSASGTTLESLSTNQYPLPSALFTAFGATTLVSGAGSVDGTLVPATVKGTQTVEGGLLRVGRVIKVKALGTLTTSVGPPNLTIYVKLGSTTVATVTNGTFASLTSQLFEIELYLSCILYASAGSTIACEGFFREFNNAASTIILPRIGTTGVAVDVTTSQTLDVRGTWAAGAGQTLSINFMSAEYIN